MRERLINHPILRDSSIHLDKGVMKTIVPVMDETELGDWIHNIQKVKHFQSEFLFNPKLYSIQDRAMCGTSCLLKLTYAICPYILMD